MFSSAALTLGPTVVRSDIDARGQSRTCRELRPSLQMLHKIVSALKNAGDGGDLAAVLCETNTNGPTDLARSSIPPRGQGLRWQAGLMAKRRSSSVDCAALAPPLLASGQTGHITDQTLALEGGQTRPEAPR